MGLWVIIAGRVACLTGERIFFHNLGEKRSGLVTTLVAFGGAAALLWVAAAIAGPLTIVPEAFYPSLIYAGHFALYTTAFSMGAISTVSPWTNVTVLVLFFWGPLGRWLAWVGVALFGVGIGLFLERKPKHLLPVVMMIGSSVLLAIGRKFDLGQETGPPLAYAASMFTWVTLWIGIVVLVLGQGRDVIRLVKERTQWSFLSAGSNAASYVTLVLLIHRLPLAALESLGSISALLATLIGAFWLMEATSGRKILASWLMSGGAVAMLLDHLRLGSDHSGI